MAGAVTMMQPAVGVDPSDGTATVVVAFDGHGVISPTGEHGIEYGPIAIDPLASEVW